MTQTSASANIFPEWQPPPWTGGPTDHASPRRRGLHHTRPPKVTLLPVHKDDQEPRSCVWPLPMHQAPPGHRLGHKAGSPGRPRRAAIHPAQRGSQQTTNACNYYAALGALNPARPFFGLSAGGPWLHVCCSCMAAPGAPATCARRARAGSGAAPLQVLNLVRRVRGGAVDLERLCLNAVRPRTRSSVTVTPAAGPSGVMTSPSSVTGSSPQLPQRLRLEELGPCPRGPRRA